MKQKLFLLLAFCMMSIGIAVAQTTVKGTVTQSTDDEPVIGATVLVKGTTTGAITDIDGNFVINNVPAGAKSLQISYIGMRTVEVAIAPTVNIVMDPETSVLDDVVVVAYGTAKKSSLTGAITQVNAEKIEARPVNSATAALEGTVAGVQINNSIGDPNNEPSIRIRGMGTVNGSSSPLYVIDGVPMGGNMNDINAADIESISILKDAASCALYGNRASNGVVLITTKRGKGREGKAAFDLKVNYGTYMRGTKEYERLEAKPWMEAYYQNVLNGLQAEGSGVSYEKAFAEVQSSLISNYLLTNIFNKPEDQLFDANGKIVAGASILPGYADDLDWFDQAIQNGKREEYVFSGNATSEKSNYYFSVGYLNNEGYVKGSGLERITGRLNVNITPKKWIAAGLNVNVSHQMSLNTSSADTGNSSSFTNVFMYARQIAPIYPVHLHNADGTYALDDNGNKQYDPGNSTRKQYQDRHVIWENELDKDKTTRNTINGIAYMDLNFLKDFTFTVKGNLSVRHDLNRTYDNSIIGNGLGAGGRTKQVNYYYKNWTFQQQLRWSHAFGDHQLEALVGHENYSNMYDYTYAFKTTETFFGKDNLTNFSDLSSLDGYKYNYTTESYLARVRYNYKDRYNVEASFRRDGSSRFHKDARWGNFGSFGANWIISQEEFMKDIDWIDNMKIRADWGQVGNDSGSGYYAYMSLYTNSTYNGQGAFYLSQNEAVDLKWETGESWGLAVETRLFDRWNLTAEYYNKRNKDLLFDVYQPLSAGATSTGAAEATQMANLGTIANYGIEIETDVDVWKNKDWRINVGANLTTLKNKIVTLPEQNKEGFQSGSYRIEEGKSMYTYNIYTFAGVDQMTGNSLYVADYKDSYYVNGAGNKVGNPDGTDITQYVTEINGQGYVNNYSYAAREWHGCAMPKVYGGFNFNVSWKNLSLTTLFTYSLGGKAIDGVYSGLMSIGSTPYAAHKDILGSWTKEKAQGITETSPNRIDPNGIPRLDYSNTYNNTTSSRWLTKKDYFIFKNVNLSYNLPRAWVKKVDLNGVSVNLACENVFTKTARQGYNPQQSIFGGGQSNANVPARTFTLGINIRL